MRIPDTEHYAVIETSFITIPGDERSRTHPGHGYPEHTEEVINYRVFDNETQLKAYLAKANLARVKIIKATPIAVTLTTEVSLS